MRFLGIDLDLLTPGRPARPRQRAAPRGVECGSEDTRILLLDLFVAVDDTIVGDGRRAG